MTEVQEAIKFERLSKFEHRYDDYDMVVEINGEEHNLDFLIDPLRNKIIFFYDYGDGDDLDDCKKEIKKLKSEHQNTLNVYEKKIKKLEKENKELKIFKDKVVEVIDNHILEETDLRKECIENGSHYSANISRNIIDTLKLIKNELSE